MMQPEFLSIDDVLRIHEDQIQCYGGSSVLRDSGLLISAVETPRAAIGGQFVHTDLFEMVAAYLFHIAQNHPFVDGNKRTGAVAALVFLDLNGVEMQIDDDELVEQVLGVAQSQLNKAQAAEFLRKHAAS